MVVGPPGIGKTSIINLLLKGENHSFKDKYEETQGFHEYDDKLVHMIHEKKVEQEFFEITGEFNKEMVEEHEELELFMKEADAIIFVAKIAEPLSFKRVFEYWMP